MTIKNYESMDSYQEFTFNIVRRYVRMGRVLYEFDYGTIFYEVTLNPNDTWDIFKIEFKIAGVDDEIRDWGKKTCIDKNVMFFTYAMHEVQQDWNSNHK